MSWWEWWATNRRLDRRISAWASQKSIPPSTPPRGAASHSARAARCAPTIEPDCCNGDHNAETPFGTVVEVGS
jgi:hypothetical protein